MGDCLPPPQHFHHLCPHRVWGPAQLINGATAAAHQTKTVLNNCAFNKKCIVIGEMNRYLQVPSSAVKPTLLSRGGLVNGVQCSFCVTWQTLVPISVATGRWLLAGFQQCDTVHYSTVLNWTEIYYTALHCISLHYIALNINKLCCTTLRLLSSLQCTICIVSTVKMSTENMSKEQ